MPPQQSVTAPADEATDEHERWLAEQDLPARPRRRLLGKGGNPLALALLGVLLAACGFIAGTLVEKGQGGGSSAAGAAGASGFAARLRAAAGSGATGASAGAAAGFDGAGGGFSRPTSGTVAYLDGGTLYVTNAEGNTVKVLTSTATSVEKTVKSKVASIHPGETVTVTGASASNGALQAEAIEVGTSGGGLAGLFAGARSRGGGTGGGGASGGGEPALFGNGG